MSVLGVHDGVALRFKKKAGTLDAIEMGRFGRSFELLEEFSAAPEPLGESLPYLPLENSLDMSDARYRGLDPYSGRQAQQTLPGGRRTISILQGQTVLAAGPADAVLARAHMDISLAAPLTWRLRLSGEAEWEVDDSGAEAYLGKGCSVRVSSTGALAIEDNGHVLSSELPAGPSTVEMWVEALPQLQAAPAIIVCAGSQVWEAAIVASAVGSVEGAYIPLLDLDLPPAGVEEIQQANNRLQEMSGQIAQLEEQMNSVAQEGAQAAGGIILPGARSAEQSIEQLSQQREAILNELEPVQRQVLDYATWSRRTAVLSRLIASLTSGSKESPVVLVLSPYPVELVAGWAANADTVGLFPDTSRQALAEWLPALQQTGAESVETVFWKDAQDLATRVWRRVHGVGEPQFFTIPDDPAFYPVGLLDALRRGRALLPRGRAGAQVNLEQIQDTLNQGNTSDHAVIVEADRSVSALVGVLYAHHTGARLFVNPTPRAAESFDGLRQITENVQKEQLAAMAANAYRYIGEHRKAFMQSPGADPQLKQIAAGLSILELPVAVPSPYSDQQFVQSLTTYLTAQQAGAQQGYRYDDTEWSKDLAALEAQVTAGVSEYVRNAVAGIQRLTVFTSGMPYSLTTGWEGKTIGLVLRDLAAGLILRNVAQAGAGRPSQALTLVLDPGLQPRPAPDAPELVDRTITLRSQNASLANLALLTTAVPLDGLVLHTQGNLDTIILADARNRLLEVHTSELGSQVRLNSSPLVVYTAPLAWLGLGVTLIEQGASGFVGALWPIEGTAAEDATRAVLSSTLVKGKNPAEALAKLPSYDTRSSRAFVYLGTADAWPAVESNPQQGMPVLYGAVARLATSGRGPMATLVHDRMRALAAEPAATDPALAAELIMLDADYQMRLSARTRERPAQDAIDKVQQNTEMLAKMRLPEGYRRELQIALWARSAALELAAQNFERAQELFTQVREARHNAGETAAEIDTAYLLSVVEERQRHWAQARQILLEVQPQLAAVGNAVGLVMVSTGLAYVSLPLAMYPDVLGHLKMATQASLELGIQVLSETLVQTLEIGKVMAQIGAYGDLVTIADTLSSLVSNDTHLPVVDRTAIAGVLDLLGETAAVLQANLPAEEREAKLAALVEKAQSNELARSLSMDTWILSAGAKPSAEAGSEPEPQP